MLCTTNRIHLDLSNAIDSFDESVEYIQCLWDNGADPNYMMQDSHDQPALLHKAAQAGYVEVIKILLKHKDIDPNIETSKIKNTPLHKASRFNRIDAMRALLEDPRVDPNIPDTRGNTPLHIAVQGNQVAPIRMLLDHERVHVNVVNDQGDTPLDLVDERDVTIITMFFRAELELLYQHLQYMYTAVAS